MLRARVARLFRHATTEVCTLGVRKSEHRPTPSPSVVGSEIASFYFGRFKFQTEERGEVVASLRAYIVCRPYTKKFLRGRTFFDSIVI